eukprot:TRINITY_DN104988_c0_g1_i1.p1 TRINITY_DN104988_c0_g1~~TRINITY_DN104988_c0_g1_i1.p1  ORF type:complete len:495 (-),score=60.34 TRINITY_DN104988_c0_g1_i1:137-1621(-)
MGLTREQAEAIQRICVWHDKEVHHFTDQQWTEATLDGGSRIPIANKFQLTKGSCVRWRHQLEPPHFRPDNQVGTDTAATQSHEEPHKTKKDKKKKKNRPTKSKKTVTQDTEAGAEGKEDSLGNTSGQPPDLLHVTLSQQNTEVIIARECVTCLPQLENVMNNFCEPGRFVYYSNEGTPHLLTQLVYDQLPKCARLCPAKDMPQLNEAAEDDSAYMRAMRKCGSKPPSNTDFHIVLTGEQGQTILTKEYDNEQESTFGLQMRSLLHTHQVNLQTPQQEVAGDVTGTTKEIQGKVDTLQEEIYQLEQRVNTGQCAELALAILTRGVVYKQMYKLHLKNTLAMIQAAPKYEDVDSEDSDYEVDLQAMEKVSKRIEEGKQNLLDAYANSKRMIQKCQQKNAVLQEKLRQLDNRQRELAVRHLASSWDHSYSYVQVKDKAANGELNPDWLTKEELVLLGQDLLSQPKVGDQAELPEWTMRDTFATQVIAAHNSLCSATV